VISALAVLAVDDQRLRGQSPRRDAEFCKLQQQLVTSGVVRTVVACLRPAPSRDDHAAEAEEAEEPEEDGGVAIAAAKCVAALAHSGEVMRALQVCVDLTQACVHPTPACVHHTQALVNRARAAGGARGGAAAGAVRLGAEEHAGGPRAGGAGKVANRDVRVWHGATENGP
jgi:hypothetical protein